jgi:hypothetical protein
MNIIKASFTSNFWKTGLAMLRYIPRSFRVKQVDGNVFFSDAKRAEFQARLENIKADAPRQWGKMDVAQMLHHLNLSSGASLGFYEVEDESYFLSRTVFRWILVDWFPEQPVGLQLPTGFRIDLDQHFDFETEKSQLLKILEISWRARSPEDWKPHPMFGKMSAKEWGKLLQIHVDYHLREFAA